MKLIDQGRSIGTFAVECFWPGIESFQHLEEVVSELASVDGRSEKA